MVLDMANEGIGERLARLEANLESLKSSVSDLSKQITTVMGTLTSAVNTLTVNESVSSSRLENIDRTMQKLIKDIEEKADKSQLELLRMQSQDIEKEHKRLKEEVANAKGALSLFKWLTGIAFSGNLLYLFSLIGKFVGSL